MCTLNNFRIVDGLCRPTFPSLDVRVHCGYPMLVSSLCIQCVGGRQIVLLVHKPLDQQEPHLDLLLSLKILDLEQRPMP